MKLEIMWGAFDSASTTLSSSCRTLALAGIALIWVFHTKNPEGEYQLPAYLVLSAIFIVISMCFDFLQYLYKAFTYNFIATSTEKWAEKILPIGSELQVNKHDNEESITNKNNRRAKILELRQGCEREVNYYWNSPTNILFLLKLFFLMLAYLHILMFLSQIIT